MPPRQFTKKSDISEPDASGIPWEVTYLYDPSYPLDLGWNVPNHMVFNSRCEKSNPGDSCAAKVCKIEQWFVDSFFAFLLRTPESDLEDILKNKFYHSNGFST